MQVFSRRGFQLRTASLETRVAYTAFLALTVLGLATLLALAIRAGVTPGAIATYYRGGESEMAFGRTFWQLTEVSHAHLFTVPVVVLILSHLLYGTPTSVRGRVRLPLDRRLAAARRGQRADRGDHAAVDVGVGALGRLVRLAAGGRVKR